MAISLWIPYLADIMYVRKLRRKTARVIAGQIVRSYRNSDGQVRQRIVRHMGTAPAGAALEALVIFAELANPRLNACARGLLYPDLNVLRQRSPFRGWCAHMFI